jgi:hypothetical protein
MIYQSIRLLCIIALSILILPVTGLPRANFRNGKIAFTSDRDGNLEIYVMNSDGTGQVRLTNNNILDAHPAWSPDGRRIAFISQRASGAYAIFAMNADGSEKVEITPVNYQPPSFPYSWVGPLAGHPMAASFVFAMAVTFMS